MNAQLDAPQVFLPDVWASHGRYLADRPAVVCGDRRITWAEFDAGMNRVANLLLADGIGRGDRVAVVMGNSPFMLEVMFGIVRAGACVVPLSAMLTAEQICHLIGDSGAVAVVVDAACAPLVVPHAGGLKTLRSNGQFANGFEAPGWRDIAALAAGADAGNPGVSYDMEDPFNIIYSSGTTGLPKGIVQTHRARQHWAYSNALEMRFHSSARALTTTPLYSNGTWFMVLPPLFVGATVHIMEKFDPKVLLETIARERITHTFMVPAQYIAALDQPTLEQTDLSSVETMLSAGSPMRQDTKADVRARMTPNLYELYGFSEGFATILKPEHAETRRGSVGLPVLGFEMEIVDDEGAVCPRGEVGEIVGRGAGMMRGYHNRPDLDVEITWTDDRGRGFIRSGDIGRMDEDGFLYILDRKKDMILSGGFNVFPKDIEDIVGQHPDVADVTVIGIPHDRWGEVPMALVIRTAAAQASAEEIRTWANERLAKTQRLQDLAFREDFPRNALGKVIKRQLRQPFWQQDEEAAQ